MTGQDVAPLRVVYVADATSNSALPAETIVTMLPGTVVEGSDTAVERGVPDADCVVIGITVNGTPGVDVLRVLRARGYRGGAVLLADGDAATVAAAAAHLGATRVVESDAMVDALAPAVVESVAAAELTGARAAPAAQLRRARQLIAAGEVAMRLQHTLNNPLAALLAEAQLLELEPLDAEHLMSVRRIIEQCRRVIDVVRQLDGIGGRQ